MTRLQHRTDGGGGGGVAILPPYRPPEKTIGNVHLLQKLEQQGNNRSTLDSKTTENYTPLYAG